MTKTIEEVVQEGIKVLDNLVYLNKLEDGWWDRIDLDELNMYNSYHCILGQLGGFNHFYYGAISIEQPAAFLGSYQGQNLTPTWEAAIIKLREERNVHPTDTDIDRLLAEEEQIKRSIQRGPEPNATIDFTYNDEPMSITFPAYPPDAVWKFQQQIAGGAFAKAKITNIRFEEVV